jgi:hypothetical protein
MPYLHYVPSTHNFSFERKEGLMMFDVHFWFDGAVLAYGCSENVNVAKKNGPFFPLCALYSLFLMNNFHQEENSKSLELVTTNDHRSNCTIYTVTSRKRAQITQAMQKKWKNVAT